MATIYAIHAPNADMLALVVEEMRILGRPTIEVVDCGDYYQALEGSHRLAAAAQLGIIPALTIHGQEDILDLTRFDWFEPQNWAGTQYPAGEVAGEIYSPRQAVAYTFEVARDFCH